MIMHTVMLLSIVRRYDDRLELAPRDIVARAIHDQLQTHGDTHVLLDISHRPSAEVLAHFPNIAAECSKAGIDVTQDPIPVVPAQHYMCGGVRTGLYGAPPPLHPCRHRLASADAPAGASQANYFPY